MGETALRVTFYGVRGSCPCSGGAISRYGGATSCVALSRGPSGEPPLILDLGTGLRQLGEDINSHPDLTRPGTPLALAALVTHLHFDHIQGLPFFVPALRPETTLDIYGPSPTDGSLGDAFAAFLRPPYFPVELAALPADIRFHEVNDAELEIGEFRVSVRLVPHVGLTCGYRVGLNGSSVAFLSDHQAPKSFDHVADTVLELCDGVDLLIHDAQYTEEEFRDKSHWGHSTVAYAIRVAREAGAKSLALYHHDPTHDDDMLDRVAAAAGEMAAEIGLGSVVMAAEGLTMSIGAPPSPTAL